MMIFSVNPQKLNFHLRCCVVWRTDTIVSEESVHNLDPIYLRPLFNIVRASVFMFPK
jgi:hypothetical protein